MFAFDITFIASLCFFLQRVPIMCPQNGNPRKRTTKMYFENAIEAMLLLHFSTLFHTKGVITESNKSLYRIIRNITFVIDYQYLKKLMISSNIGILKRQSNSLRGYNNYLQTITYC